MNAAIFARLFEEQMRVKKARQWTLTSTLNSDTVHPNRALVLWSPSAAGGGKCASRRFLYGDGVSSPYVSASTVLNSQKNRQHFTFRPAVHRGRAMDLLLAIC